MKEQISQFLDAEAKAGYDPIYTLSSLLARQIVETACSEWRGVVLELGFEPNRQLPDVPDDLLDVFLRLAEGRPADSVEADDDDDVVTVEWLANGWLWRFNLTEAGSVSKTAPMAGKLLEKLPGRMTADFRLTSNETAFNIHIDAGDDLRLTGSLDSNSFETTCERKQLALLATIRKIHDSCCCTCLETEGAVN